MWIQGIKCYSCKNNRLRKKWLENWRLSLLTRWKCVGDAESPAIQSYTFFPSVGRRTFQYAEYAVKSGLNMGECQDDWGNIRA
jgi:hypothetical protein